MGIRKPRNAGLGLEAKGGWRRLCVFLFSPILTMAASGALAQQTEDLTSLDLTQLGAIKVSSVSKRPEKLREAAAAAYVISSEDIRRSGATSIPELLRLAPGVEVARIDANKWAISIRGFNSQFANKLLVLIDGRSVYTPLFSGVFWDVQDTNIEDIDRIEVIRGPGATLWGANAVNGVINIITKKSEDTQGASLTGIIGDEAKGTGSFRYGAALSDRAHLRIYGKYFEKDASKLVGGGDAADGWKMKRTGFRTDWSPAESDKLVLMGDYYDGKVGESGITTDLTAPYAHPFAVEYTVKGHNVLARWNHGFSDGEGLMLQGTTIIPAAKASAVAKNATPWMLNFSIISISARAWA